MTTQARTHAESPAAPRGDAAASRADSRGSSPVIATPYEIPLTRPYVSDRVKDRINRTLDSGWLTEGPAARELESLFREWIGCGHVIATNSCTIGLELGLRAIGLKPGDEVIVPDYTYPCTASIVALLGGTAVIVDVDPATMLIDIDAMERAVTPKTAAIIPVSLFGNPLDYDRINEFARSHELAVIEDAACTIGAEYKGRPVGSQVDLCVFSMHPRKILTTGEGGLICTSNDEWAAWIRSYKAFGMRKTESGTTFELLGSNHKLSDIQAAAGVGMFEDLPMLLTSRRDVAAAYMKRLADVPGVELPVTTEHGLHSWQTFPVFVDERDRIMQDMRDRGIEAQIGTYALHMHPAFQDQPGIRLAGDLSNSRRAYHRCLALPIFHGMSEAQIDRVCDELRDLAPSRG